MKKHLMTGAAVACAAGMIVAQSVMAGPIKEFEPVERSWENGGAPRGHTTTETQRELEPVEMPVGGSSALRGWVALEGLQVARFGTLIVRLDIASFRRSVLGR